MGKVGLAKQNRKGKGKMKQIESFDWIKECDKLEKLNTILFDACKHCLLCLVASPDLKEDDRDQTIRILLEVIKRVESK